MPIIINNTAYSGEVAEQILTLATTGNELVEKGLIHIVPGIHEQLAIPRLRQGKVLQRHVAMPDETNAKGGTTWSERYLRPTKIMAYDRFNPATYEHIWRKYQPTGNLLFEQLSPEIQGKMIDLFLKQVQMEFGDNLINGVYVESEKDTIFNGIVKRMADDSDKIVVETTETSIIKRLKALRGKIPAALRANPALKIIMSLDDFDKYDEELTALPAKGVDYGEISKARYKGISIEVLSRWPEGLFVSTPVGLGSNSNLWAAVNFADDTEAIKIDRVKNDGELYFIKLLFKVDTQIAQGEELVWLDKRTPVTPAV
jgi:hypothetical protein